MELHIHNLDPSVSPPHAPASPSYAPAGRTTRRCRCRTRDIPAGTFMSAAIAAQSSTGPQSIESTAPAAEIFYVNRSR